MEKHQKISRETLGRILQVPYTREALGEISGEMSLGKLQGEIQGGNIVQISGGTLVVVPGRTLEDILENNYEKFGSLGEISVLAGTSAKISRETPVDMLELSQKKTSVKFMGNSGNF